MDYSEEDKFHLDVIKFMDTVNYEVGHVIIDCNEDTEDLIKKLRSEGCEVFLPTIQAGDECKILYRRKKPSP